MSFSIFYNIELKDKFSNAARRVSRSSKKVSDAMGRVGRSASAAGRAVKRTGIGLHKFGTKLMSLKGLLLGAVGFKVGQTLLNFETGMNKVKATAEATTDQFIQLRRQAKELGRTTEFSASQVASGQAFLAKAGFKTQKIIDSMPATLDLAAAASLDLASAADIVSNVMAGFGIKNEHLGGAVDVLAKAFISSNTDLLQLGQAMKFAGPVAKGMGVDFEETADFLGILGSAGIQASMAGTSLRGALTKLSTPVARGKKLLKAYKIEVKDIHKNLLPLNKIIEQFEKKNVKASHVMEIFGLRAGPAMIAAIGAGSEKLRDFTLLLKNSAGTAKRVARTKMEGLPGAFKKLTSSIEGLIITLGEKGLTKTLTDIANILTLITRLVSKVIPKFSSLGEVVTTTFGGGMGKLLHILASKGLASLAKEDGSKGKAGESVVAGGRTVRSSFRGNMNIDIRDKGKNVESVQTDSFGDMKLGFSGVGKF